MTAMIFETLGRRYSSLRKTFLLWLSNIFRTSTIKQCFKITHNIVKEIILGNKPTTVRLQRLPESLPAPQDVAAFESTLGYELPADYREFLLRYNGGVCELKNIIVPVSGYLCDLYSLFPDGFSTDLMKLRLPSSDELTELWGALPPNLLPIGEVDSGDMIAIRFDEGGAAIVVISHEDDALSVVHAEASFTDLLSNTKRESD